MVPATVSVGEVPLRTILVADDDPLVRKLLAAQLGNLGCRLVFAADGPEALARVEADRPDLVLLDIVMPGLDGFEVCRRIKGSLDTQHVPVIHFTSLGAEAKAQSFAAGADDFLNKPLNPAELRSRVRSHLLIRSLQDELKATGGRRAWGWEPQPRARLLAVVADVDLREWVVDTLRGQGQDVLWADSLRASLERLALGLPDLLVLDHQLPDGAAQDFVGHLRSFARSRDLPVLQLCPRDLLRKKPAGGDSGPQDFLAVPSNAAELRVRVEVLLREGRLLQGRSADRIGLERDLLLDPPTGAYSEAFLEAWLTLAQGGRRDQPLALAGAGCYQPAASWLEAKQLVARTARFLSGTLGPGEALCRVADRTFVLLLPGCSAEALQQRLARLAEAGFEGALAGLPVPPGATAGTLLRSLAHLMQQAQGTA